MAQRTGCHILTCCPAIAAATYPAAPPPPSAMQSSLRHPAAAHTPSVRPHPAEWHTSYRHNPNKLHVSLRFRVDADLAIRIQTAMEATGGQNVELVSGLPRAVYFLNLSLLSKQYGCRDLRLHSLACPPVPNYLSFQPAYFSVRTVTPTRPET